MKKKPHSDVLDRIVYDLASSIDSPRSLAAWLCYKHNHRELLELPAADPAGNDTLRFQQDYFITEYLKKYKGLKADIDLRAVALEKWLASENDCRDTNERFRKQLRGFSPRVSGLLFETQRKIAAILGQFDLYSSSTQCRWATGATLDILKQDAAPDNKMIRPISVTRSALPYLRIAIEHDPHWFHAISGVFPDGPYCVTPLAVKLVQGSRFLTVPKSAKTDRCIAAEPTGNGFLQQGLHLYMRKRLKRFGVDLDNQARNQHLAQRAYREGYATLDLSAASDSISWELVFHLLPLDWALFMDDLRSHYTRVDKTWVKTEKFVSMGNAFCFELESLIFYALARAVCGEDCMVEVYGDDIIVPRAHAAELIELLQLCGFRTNVSKSFTEGNFFESCGEHYHMGSRVTPPYQKEVLTDPSERVRAHNRLVRFGLTLPDCPLKRKISKMSKWVIGNHPDLHCPKIPFGVEGDDGYLVDPLRLLKVYDKNHGFKCRVLVWKNRFKPAISESALYAYRLRKYRTSLKASCAFWELTLRRDGTILSHGTALTTFNPQGSGWAGHEASGRWVYKTRWIPESDTCLCD